MILAGDYIPKQKAVHLDLPPGTILANLEGPVLGDRVLTPSPKSGPSLYSRAFEPDGRSFIFMLANNHLMDYGEAGLEATKSVLAKAGVPFCGAGANLEEARLPLVVTESGKKIGIISCCERQFGCAEIAQPGVAEKGHWLVSAVKRLKQSVDFVIVSCHAAFEHSPFPSPRLREFYHLLIHAGADVIHGHHSHVPQGWETYRDGLILYGLGNFAVDPDSWGKGNYLWSIIVHLDFSSNKIGWSLSFADIRVSEKGGICVGLVEGDARERHDRYCQLCNMAFDSDAMNSALWQEICVLLFDRYYGVPLHSPGYKSTCPLTTRNRLRYLFDGCVSLLAGVSGRKLRSKKELQRGLTMLNFFQCESHCSVMETALGVLSGTVLDQRTKLTYDIVKELIFS